MMKKFAVGLAAIPVAVAAYRLLKRSGQPANPVVESEALEVEAAAPSDPDADVIEAVPADDAVIPASTDPAPVVDSVAPPVIETARSQHQKKKRARKRNHRSGARSHRT